MEIFQKDFAGEVGWSMVLYRGKTLLKTEKNIFLVPFEYLF
jgi:hypothetical protein